MPDWWSDLGLFTVTQGSGCDRVGFRNGDAKTKRYDSTTFDEANVRKVNRKVFKFARGPIPVHISTSTIDAYIECLLLAERPTCLFNPVRPSIYMSVCGISWLSSIRIGRWVFRRSWSVGGVWSSKAYDPSPTVKSKPHGHGGTGPRLSQLSYGSHVWVMECMCGWVSVRLSLWCCHTLCSSMGALFRRISARFNSLTQTFPTASVFEVLHTFNDLAVCSIRRVEQRYLQRPEFAVAPTEEVIVAAINKSKELERNTLNGSGIAGQHLHCEHLLTLVEWKWRWKLL